LPFPSPHPTPEPASSGISTVQHPNGAIPANIRVKRKRSTTTYVDPLHHRFCSGHSLPSLLSLSFSSFLYFFVCMPMALVVIVFVTPVDPFRTVVVVGALLFFPPLRPHTLPLSDFDWSEHTERERERERER